MGDLQLLPPQLLERTQVAVGEQQMSEWHQKLIALRKEEKQLRSVSDESQWSHVEIQINKCDSNSRRNGYRTRSI